MHKRPLLLLLALVSLTLCSCTSMVRQTIPKPGPSELTGRKYFVTLQDGKVCTTGTIRANNDSAYFNGRGVKLEEIKAVETKKFSIGKTLALWGLVYLSAGIFGTLYLVSLANGSQ